MASIIYNKIFWNKEKSKKLKEERGISFEEINTLIIEDKIVDIIKHYNQEIYQNQDIMVFNIYDYTYLVPFYKSK